MNVSMSRRLLPIAAVLLSPLLASQQNAFIPHTGETIDVSIVNVELFVTDKNGKRVRGLGKDDFEVFENGVRQPITNFTEYASGDAVAPKNEAPAAGALTAAAVEPPRSQKRTVIVFVEHFHLTETRSKPMFDSLKTMLHNVVRPGDSAIVVWYDHGSIVTRQRFTDDLAALDRALDQIQRDVGGAFIDEYQRAYRDARDLDGFIKESTLMAEQAFGVLQERDSDPGWRARNQARTQAAEVMFDQQRKIETLKALIRAVSADDGKKLMILATRRLSRKAGAEFFFAADQGPFALQDTHAEFDMRPDLKSLYETANASAVTIYPIYAEAIFDPQPIEAGVTRTERVEAVGGATGLTDERSMPTMIMNGQRQSEVLENEKLALEDLASHTGGMMATGPAAIAKLLPRVQEDLQWYYSLAYRTRPGMEGLARNVVVKAKNPGYTIRSRQEYVEKSDTTRMEDRVISALFRPATEAPFHIAAEVGKARSQGRQMVIPVSLRIPIMKLTPLPEEREFNGAFSVYTAWGTRLRGISRIIHETKAYSIPADQMQRARRSYYTYTIELLTDPSTDRVAFGVLDEVSKDYALKVVDVAAAGQGTR
jgi:VWFA-related protein